MKRTGPIYLFCLGLAVTLLHSCSSTDSEIESQQEKVETKLYMDAANIVRVGNSKTGFSFTNLAGDTLFDNRKYNSVSPFKDGYCVVTKLKDGKFLRGVIDLRGEEVVPVKFTEYISSYFDGGYFRITKEGGGSGIIDSTGKVLIRPIYKKTRGGIKYDQAIVQNSEDKWGSVSINGGTILDFVYKNIGNWSDERALLEYSNGKFAYANTKGKTITDERYDYARDFESGIALVVKNGLIGFIDNNANTVIEHQFSDYMIINDVEKDPLNNMEYIKKSEYFMMDEGYIIVKKNGKWGYINSKGETVIPFEFDKINVLGKGSRKVNVTKDGKKGFYLIDEKRFEEDKPRPLVGER